MHSIELLRICNVLGVWIPPLRCFLYGIYFCRLIAFYWELVRLLFFFFLVLTAWQNTLLQSLKNSKMKYKYKFTMLDRETDYVDEYHLALSDFLVIMYGCESWTIKKAEHRRIDAFELWCWRRRLRVPWTARRSKQSILKEISPECSLEGLMLKLKL